MLNSLQKEVLAGCSLGDISFDYQISGKARFQMCQSVKYKTYLLHKYEMFKDLVKSEPKVKDEKRKYPSIYFNTMLDEDIGSFAKMFFSENIRGVPQNIEELITPRSLAYWFMDDGTSQYPNSQRLKNKKSYVILCTDRYSEKDVDLLISMLKNKFQINSKKKTSPSMEGRIRIYIGTGEADKFFDIIEPFMFADMMYKIKRPICLQQ